LYFNSYRINAISLHEHALFLFLIFVLIVYLLSRHKKPGQLLNFNFDRATQKLMYNYGRLIFKFEYVSIRTFLFMMI